MRSLQKDRRHCRFSHLPSSTDTSEEVIVTTFREERAEKFASAKAYCKDEKRTMRPTTSSCSMAAVLALFWGSTMGGPLAANAALHVPYTTIPTISLDQDGSKKPFQVSERQPRESSWIAAIRPESTALPSFPWLSSNVVAADAQEEDTFLDEVWTLVDKYFVDKKKNVNWANIKTEYKNKFLKARDDSSRFKIVSEMVQTLNDKYSRMLDVSQYAAIQRFDLIGVGATLMPNEAKEIMVGAPPIPNSAADKAGLKVGDIITKVNGVATTGRTAFDIIDQISEAPNSKTVTMTVLPAEAAAKRTADDPSPSSAEYEVTLERTLQKVENPVRYKLNQDGDTKVGFIRIGEFNNLVIPKLEEALDILKKEGAQAFVIDLRQNTGGAFQSAVEISSLFMSEKIATYVVDNGEVKLPFKTAKGALQLDSDIPLVIWIDGRSASASEVLAASLHDNCRAVLMGSNSFGKGLIQAVYGLKNGAGLVLTVARYVTPAGNDIQGKGITPDLEGNVPLSLPGIALGTDTSKIDFADIRQRLSMCQIPEPLS